VNREEILRQDIARYLDCLFDIEQGLEIEKIDAELLKKEFEILQKEFEILETEDKTKLAKLALKIMRKMEKIEK